MGSENKKHKAKNSYCYNPEKWDENTKMKRIMFYRKKNREKNKREARKGLKEHEQSICSQ